MLLNSNNYAQAIRLTGSSTPSSIDIIGAGTTTNQIQFYINGSAKAAFDASGLYIVEGSSIFFGNSTNNLSITHNGSTSINYTDSIAIQRNATPVLTFDSSGNTNINNTLTVGNGIVFQDGTVQNSTVNSLDYSSLCQNWTALSIGAATFNGCAISATGQYQTVTSTNIYYSQNYGQTWSNAGLPTQPYNQVAMSSSGQYQITSVTNSNPSPTPTALGSPIYLSTTFGQTWNVIRVNTTNNFVYFCMSGNGQYQYAVAVSPSGSTYSIYNSTNYGQNWSISRIHWFNRMFFVW